MLEQQISEMLLSLSEVSGVASEKIWELALIQVKVDIITIIGFTLFAVIACIIYYKVMKFLVNECEEKMYSEWREVAKVIFGLTGGVVIVAMIIVSVMGLSELPKLIMNPEYSAFQKILSELGKLKP